MKRFLTIPVIAGLGGFHQQVSGSLEAMPVIILSVESSETPPIAQILRMND